ncbi:MAG: efflux RND transporter periplasmic adaptor subunit [Candidatus Methylophosphatis roskildensis]
MPKLRVLLLVLLGALLAVGFVFVMVRSGPMAPVRVTTAKAGASSLENAVFGIGTTEARRSYQIGPTVASRVKRVWVDVGESVHSGQLLAEMDPVDLDERSLAAAAAMARARHNVDAASAQLRDAQARQQVASRNAQRYAALGEKSFFSRSAVEAKQQEAESARAASTAAAAQLEAARLDLARLSAERAAMDKQRANIRLHAPEAGIVTSRDAEPGSTLIAGQSVVRLVDPHSVWVKTRVDQARAGDIRAGQPARILLRSRPGQPLAGKVARVEIDSDSVTEERIVQVAFDPLPQVFSLGELAEVTIVTAHAADVLAVPNAAVHIRGESAGVWRIDGSGIEFVPIRKGATSLDGRVVVLEGLSGGEIVVAHSERELKPGDAVKVVDKLDGGRS